MIPYGRQDIDAADLAAVAQVLSSEFLTQGPSAPAFESKVAAYCGSPYAVAVTNATSALHLACLALGLGPGDTLWTSPNSFVASANCARYCGAKVDFVDIDPDTYNMDPEALRLKLEQADRKNQLPKVIIPVHFAGQPCDMKTISALAQKYGIAIIEDASHALGAEICGQKVGSCAYSDISVFSFHPVKIITTGEGGMLLTRREDLHRKLVRLRSHGITRDPLEMEGESEGPWYYQQIDLGYNFRMTDLQAALGSSQMDRLDLFVARRRALAQRYDALLSSFPLTLPRQSPESKSSFHLYPVQLRPDSALGRRRVFEALRQQGVGVNVHYIPIHTQPYYRRLGFQPGDFPRALAYYERAISLPMYFGLTEAEQDFVVAALRRALEYSPSK